MITVTMAVGNMIQEGLFCEIANIETILIS